LLPNTLVAATLAAVLAGPAMAQSSGWDFAVSPYLWAPGINASVGTALGTVGVDKSSRDVLSDLDLAFMGTFEARNGRWGLIADLFYAELSQSRATPLGLLFSRARIEIAAKELSGYAAYRVNENDRVALDLMAGFRVSSIDLDLSLSPGLLGGRRLGVSETWIDPVIGGRVRFAITDKWFATAFGDVGGAGGDSDLTWQAFASLGYQFNPRWSVQGGWRYFSAEKEIEGRDVKIDYSGPLLGFTARF
jgi:outer membrane receptor protein involved in Fe transport